MREAKSSDKPAYWNSTESTLKELLAQLDHTHSILERLHELRECVESKADSKDYSSKLAASDHGDLNGARDDLVFLANQNSHCELNKNLLKHLSGYLKELNSACKEGYELAALKDKHSSLLNDNMLDEFKEDSAQWLELADSLQNVRNNNSKSEELENKIKTLESQLGVYRIEADKSLLNREELNEKDLANLQLTDVDEGDIH